MSAPRLYSHNSLLALLAPYQARLKFKLAGFELWETGWGFAFTISPEPPQMYSEEQVRRAMAVVVESIPADWFANGNGPEGKA